MMGFTSKYDSDKFLYTNIPFVREKLTLGLKRLQKMHLKMSASVICRIYLLTLLTNVSIEANSVDQDQTASMGAV